MGDPGMCSSWDDTRLVLVGFQSGDADDDHMLIVFRRVRKNDPQMPIQFREEGETRLHGSPPKQFIEKAMVRLISFNGCNQLCAALSRQSVLPGNIAHPVTTGKMLLPLRKLVG